MAGFTGLVVLSVMLSAVVLVAYGGYAIGLRLRRHWLRGDDAAHGGADRAIGRWLRGHWLRGY